MAPDAEESIQFFEQGVVTVRNHIAQAWIRPSFKAATQPSDSAVTTSTDEEECDPTVVRTPLVGHIGGYDLAFSPDRRLVATARGKDGVELWDRAKGERMADLLPGRGSFLTYLAFRSDSRLLAAGGIDGTVWLWDPMTGDQVGELLASSDGNVTALAFSPGGVLAIGRGWGLNPRANSPTSVVQLWDPVAGSKVGDPISSNDTNVISLAFSPDGRTLVIGTSNGRVRLVDRATGDPAGEPFTGHDSFVKALAFSPDGRILATGGNDSTVRLWDLRTHGPIGHPLTGHSTSVDELTFSPDGRLLVSTSHDRTLRFWDPAIGLPIGDSFIDHGGSAHALTFCPDGQLLALVTRIHTKTDGTWSAPRKSAA